MKKITLIGANLETGNMGVSALMMGAITCVKHAWPNATVSLMDYDSHHKSFNCLIKGEIVPVKLVPLRFSKKFYLPNNIAFLCLLSVIIQILPFKTLKQRILQTNLYLKHLNDSDMVLSIAGGDSFSDIYGMERYIYVVLLQILTITMSKKLVVLPQTIGPFRSVFASRIAAYILKHSTAVYCRDHESLTAAKKLIGKHTPEKVMFSYDMGFVLDPVKPEVHVPKVIHTKLQRKVLIGLNISGLLCMGGYNHNNMFTLKVDYSDLIRSLITYLVIDKKCAILLIPHVFGDAPESDVRASARFFEEFNSEFSTALHLVKGTFNQNEIKYIIGKCDFFIGSRMHACIAALSQSIPAVGIAYSRKFAGVLESIGVPDLIADPRIISDTDIIKLIGNVLDSRQAWKKLLKKRMPKITDAVLNFLKCI